MNDDLTTTPDLTAPDLTTGDVPAERTGRRGFLRQVGATVALGLGMVPLLATQAAAVSCCPNPTACGGGCPSGQRRFRCQCPTPYCTGCQSRSSCYSGPC